MKMNLVSISTMVNKDKERVNNFGINKFLELFSLFSMAGAWQQKNPTGEGEVWCEAQVCVYA